MTATVFSLHNHKITSVIEETGGLIKTASSISDFPLGKPKQGNKCLFSVPKTLSLETFRKPLQIVDE